MDEELDKIEELRKRGRISAGQAEKLRQALPAYSRREASVSKSRRRIWTALGAAGACLVVALFAWSQWRIQDSTRRIESNLAVLRRQGMVLPTHFRPAIAPDTIGSELAYEKDGRRLGLPLRKTEVQVDIHTDAARVVVNQVFVNPTDQAIEAVYVFPLPQNSAVDSMIMTVGSKRIVGRIRKRAEARATYERARAEGKTASLLEQERPDIFTQSVANILPKDTILITLSFLQEIKHIAPEYHYHFPAVVGPRYTAHTEDAARITPPVASPANAEFAARRPSFALSLRLRSAVPVRNLESASHKLVVESLEENDIRLRLADGDSIANKDFLLKYRLAGEAIEPALQAEDGHFKITVLPEFDPVPAQVFGRELVFVMDVSGSMHGYPLDKSKEVMARLLRNLRREDRFRLVTFASGTEQLSEEALEGNEANIAKALAMVASAEGGGGTEMLAAVRKVLAFPHREDTRRIFLFLTDGYIGNEQDIIRTVRDNLGGSRVFALGVGSSVNRYLLEGMALVGRGVARFIRQDGNAERAMEDFYGTIESPVLSDLSLEWQGVETEAVMPSRLPDLFLGHPLVVVGKYRGPGKGSVTLAGSLPGGGKYRKTLPVDFANLAPSVLAVKPLWARRKVEDLEIRRSGVLGAAGTRDDSTRATIEKIGLEYRIMTKHTSFVAVLEEIRNAKGEWITLEQLVDLPEGMDTAGVMGHIPQSVGLKLIASKTSSGSLSAYDLMNHKFAQDLDQVMANVSGLTPTRMGGRRGSVDGGWNEGEPVGGHGGVDDLLEGLWGGDAGPLGGGMGMKIPIESALSRSSDTVRSAESILRVVRMHAPGLRHTRNKHLKTHAGLKGKITLRITIEAGGEISEAILVSSTTGVPEFDEEIRRKVASWRFEPVKGAAKDIVTIPLTFEE